MREEEIRDLRQLVGQDHLLAQTKEKTVDTFCHIASVNPAVTNLMGHSAIPDDGTGNQLWEHRDIEQQMAKIALHGRLLTIDIHQIGYRLEHIKADANGQGYLGHREIKAKTVDRLCEEG